jgi:hypothetical protein
MDHDQEVHQGAYLAIQRVYLSTQQSPNESPKLKNSMVLHKTTNRGKGRTQEHN